MGVAAADERAGQIELRARPAGDLRGLRPQQAGGSEQVDGRADIYALACVMFEMLAGEPPFTGRTAQALLARHLHERPPSLQVVRPTVTEGLQVAVEKALAKVPADRFTSATGFADALDAAHLASISGSARVEQVRRRPRPRFLVGAAAIVVAALVVARVAMGRDPAPDPNRVVVYPLSVPGASAADAGVGEQVALMIESVLEHTEPLRWLDGQALLGPSVDARLLGQEAAKIARRTGARYYLSGALVSSRDSHTVILRLHDTVADSMVRQESMTGPVATTSPPQLALRAVALILPRLLPPNGRVDVSYLADRNPAAVAEWLQGERDFNRSRYASALEHINRALSRDSSLGVAALKGALATTYLQDYGGARRLLDVTLRHESQLPRHHLELARGLAHFLAGRADSALSTLARASAMDTTWSVPWMLIAETNIHLMPASSSDSVIEQSLTRAIQLDNGFAPALQHLTEFATRRGERRRARDLLHRIEAASPDSDLTFQVSVMVRCVFDGPNTIDWRGAALRASKDLADVARILAGGGFNPACARRALESVLAYDTDTSAIHSIFRWSALKGLNYLAMMEGQDTTARALLDSANGAGVRAAVSLHVFNDAAGSRASRASADSAIATLTTLPISRMSTTRLRYLSLWSWNRGDTIRLDSVARRVRVIADSTKLGTDRMVLDATDARLALLRGDTTTAVARLKGIRPAADPSFITWDPWESAGSERLLLARLQLATGDAEGAWRTAATFDSPRSQVDGLYLAGSLSVRLRAARQLGRDSDRSRIEARLRALGRQDLITSESTA